MQRLQRRISDGEGRWALEELTDDQLGDPKTFLGLRFLFWAFGTYSSDYLSDLILIVIRRLPPYQLVEPILNSDGDVPGTGMYSGSKATTIVRRLFRAQGSLESHIEAVVKILLNCFFLKKHLIDAVASLFYYKDTTLRFILECTPISKAEVISHFLENHVPVQGGPSLSPYALDILEEHLTADHALTLLHRQITKSGSLPSVSRRLLQLISPASLLATRKINMRHTGPPMSALWRVCASQSTVLLREILPLLTQEEIERQEEDGKTVLFACMSHNANIDLITTLCGATSREFRFLRDHDGNTALDVFNANRTMRAGAGVRTLYNELLSPRAKKA